MSIIDEIRARGVNSDETTGKPIFTDHSWQTLVQCFHFIGRELRWNETRGDMETCLTNKTEANNGFGAWEPISDHLEHVMRADIYSKCLHKGAVGKPKHMSWSKPKWDDAAHKYAQATPVNPPLQYILQHAGNAKDMSDDEADDHLTHVLRDALGVDMANPLNQWAAKAIWVGVVQRICEPGGVQRIIPVLIGEQDCGKSAFFRHMLPKELAEYFQPNVNLFGEDSEFVHSTMGVVLGECPELAGAGRADARKFKARIGIGVDKVRLKYARHATTTKRTMYLVGTANREQALPRDHTGTTRFVTVDCPGPRGNLIGAHRTVALRREACWTAAARLFFHAKTKFDPAFLPKSLRTLQDEANKEHVPVNDAYAALIAEYVQNTMIGELNVLEIAHASGVVEQGRDVNNMQVADIKMALRNAGCREVRRRVGEATVRLWKPPSQNKKVVPIRTGIHDLSTTESE